MAEIFPSSWLEPGMEKKILEFIQYQAISAKKRKHLLYEWCKTVGVEMTVGMVEYVTKPVAEKPPKKEIGDRIIGEYVPKPLKEKPPKKGVGDRIIRRRW